MKGGVKMNTDVMVIGYFAIRHMAGKLENGLKKRSGQMRNTEILL